MKKKIHAAPDVVVAISDFFDKNSEKEKGLKILESYGIDTTKEIICFQCPPLSDNDYQTVLENLIKLRETRRAEVVLLPIGYCHDDHICTVLFVKAK